MFPLLDALRARRWIDVQTAARALGVSPSTIRHWIDMGALAAFRPPGTRTIRIAGEEFARFVAEGMTTL